jgi:hypothetical protein
MWGCVAKKTRHQVRISPGIFYLLTEDTIYIDTFRLYQVVLYCDTAFNYKRCTNTSAAFFTRAGMGKQGKGKNNIFEAGQS